MNECNDRSAYGREWQSQKFGTSTWVWNLAFEEMFDRDFVEAVRCSHRPFTSGGVAVMHIRPTPLSIWLLFS